MRHFIEFLWASFLLNPGFLSANCGLLLKNGLFNTENINSSSKSQGAFRDWACTNASSYSSADMGAGFKGFSFNFGSNDESASSACSETAINTADEKKFQLFQSIVSVDLAQKFNDCINAAGLHVWLEFSSNPTAFIFAAKFVPAGLVPTPQLNQIDVPSGWRCNTKTPIKLIPGNVYRVRCSRPEGDQGGQLIVNASQNPVGAESLKIPPIRQSPKVCPSLAGSWNTTTVPTITFSQNGCSISSRFIPNGIEHLLVGSYNFDNSLFEYTVDRTDHNKNDCTVRFYGQLFNIQPTAYNHKIYRTSGACGFAVDWVEYGSGIKIN